MVMLNSRTVFLGSENRHTVVRRPLLSKSARCMSPSQSIEPLDYFCLKMIGISQWQWQKNVTFQYLSNSEENSKSLRILITYKSGSNRIALLTPLILPWHNSMKWLWSVSLASKVKWNGHLNDNIYSLYSSNHPGGMCMSYPIYQPLCSGRIWHKVNF